MTPEQQKLLDMETRYKRIIIGLRAELKVARGGRATVSDGADATYWQRRCNEARAHVDRLALDNADLRRQAEFNRWTTLHYVLWAIGVVIVVGGGAIAFGATLSGIAYGHGKLVADIYKMVGGLLGLIAFYSLAFGGLLKRRT